MENEQLIAKRMDHLVALFDTKDECLALYQFFTETLNLPVLWPLSRYPDQNFSPLSYYDGLVYFGNTAIEFFHLPAQGAVRRFFKKLPASFVGISYEPVNLTVAQEQLDLRGFQHTNALPNFMDLKQLSPHSKAFLDEGKGLFTRKGFSYPKEDLTGERLEKYQAFQEPELKTPDTILPFRMLFVELKNCKSFDFIKKYLGGSEAFEGLHCFGHLMKRDTVTIFLVEFNTRTVDQAEVLARKNQEHNGGPLGVEKIEKVLLCAEDPSSMSHELNRFFGSSRSDETWKGPNGSPDLHLVSEKKNTGIYGIVIKVRELSAAKQFLQTKNIDTQSTLYGLQLDREAMGGLRIFIN